MKIFLQPNIKAIFRAESWNLEVQGFLAADKSLISSDVKG